MSELKRSDLRLERERDEGGESYQEERQANRVLTVLGKKLSIGTKVVNFEILWTWLALGQTSGVVSGIYPFIF